MASTKARTSTLDDLAGRKNKEFLGSRVVARRMVDRRSSISDAAKGALSSHRSTTTTLVLYEQVMNADLILFITTLS